MNRYYYNKTKKKGIIERMWDTYKMWRMVMLLKKNHHSWVESKHKEEQNETTNQANTRFIKQVLEASNRKSEPEILTIKLTIEYLNKYVKGCSTDTKMTDWDNAVEKIAHAKSIIFDCKDKDFIRYTSDQRYLYITLKGKKFATFEGLLKEWITDDIGPLWSVLVAIIGTAGAFNFDWVIKITGYISPWW